MMLAPFLIILSAFISRKNAASTQEDAQKVKLRSLGLP